MIAGTLTYDTKMDTNGLQKGVNGVKNIIAGLGITKIIGKAFDVLTNSIDGAISRIDTLNNFPKVMSNLGIGAKESQEAIDDLSKRLQGIPTTLDDAALAVQRFTSKNGDVKKSVDIFDAVNNAILAGGASADIQRSALEQLSQAYAKGKPDMMEWRTLQTAMPAQLKQVAQAMGTTTEQLGEDLRNGRISMDQFIDKIVEMNKTGSGEFKSFSEQARNATGGIKTGITNAKTAVVRGVGDIISSINESLINSGIGSIGDIFTKVGKTAENALKWIGQKVAEYAPIIINKVKETIKKIQEWAEKAQLKKALENIWETTKVVAKNILEAIKPIYNFIKDIIIPMIEKLIKTIATKIDTKSLEKFNNTLKAMQPLLTAVLAGILAFKAATIVIEAIKGISAAIKGLTTSLASNPFALLAALIAAVAVATYNWRKETIEACRAAETEVGDKLSKMQKGFDDYGNAIQSAKSRLDVFNTKLFQTTEEQSKMQNEIDSLQEAFTRITSKAVKQRRELTESEIKTLEEYMKKIYELKQEQQKLEEAVGDAIAQQAEEDAKNVNRSMNEYKQSAEEMTKTAQEQKDKIVDAAKQTYTERIANATRLYGEEGKLNKKAYDAEIKAANENKNNAIKLANEKYSRVTAAYQQGFDKEMEINGNTIRELRVFTSKRKEILEEAKAMDENFWMKWSTYGIMEKTSRMQELEKELARIDQQIVKDLDDATIEEIGVWAKNIEETKKAGGEISEENKKMAQEIIDVYNSLDNDTQAKMSGMMESLKNIVKNDSNKLVGETDNLAKKMKDPFKNIKQDTMQAGIDFLEGLFQGINNQHGKSQIMNAIHGMGSKMLANLKSSLQEQSPSKATREMGYFFDKGLEMGIKENKKSVFDTIDRFGDEIVSKMDNAVSLETDKVTAKAFLTNNIDKTIVINASFDGNVEMDNKKVGRILAPDISQALKVGGL